MNVEDIKGDIFDSFEIDERLLPSVSSNEEKFKAFRNLLIMRIEELADRDMSKLFMLLYRVDVNEKKMREILNQTAPSDFGVTIADLIIARQIEKAESRKKFGSQQTEWNFDI